MSTPKFTPVTRRRAYQSVMAQIEEMILVGRLRPGDRLPSEREMCAQMGVSRPTVREAVRTLESAGVLVLRPHDPTGGAEVRLPDGSGLERSLRDLVRFSQLSLGDLIGFRLLIESTACHLAARHQDAARIADIVAAQQAVEVAVEGSTDEEFVAADVEFHAAVARAAGNRLIELCTSAVESAMAGLIGDAMNRTSGAAKRDFARRHDAILAAIRAGDAPRAAACARQDIVDCYLPLVHGEEARSVRALEALVIP